VGRLPRSYEFIIPVLSNSRSLNTKKENARTRKYSSAGQLKSTKAMIEH
jgi:hypothetical protein